MILLLQLIVFPIQHIRAQSIKDIMLSNGIIYTKTDTIKCFIPMDENMQLYVKYKIRREDQKFQRLNVNEIITLKRGVNSYKTVEYKSEKILLEVDVEGKISLFENSNSNPNSYGMTTGSNTYYPPALTNDSRIYYLSDSIQICKLNRTNYKDEIKKMLVGGESFYDEIDRLKYSNICIDLPRIISNYNLKVKNL